MPDGSTLALYCGAVLALLVVPGPSVLYIVTRSIDQGRRAGLVSVAGIHVGTVVHIAEAAFGISAVVARSATAFTAVKLAAAAYLIALGIVRIVRRPPSTDVDAAPRSVLPGLPAPVHRPRRGLGGPADGRSRPRLHRARLPQRRATRWPPEALGAGCGWTAGWPGLSTSGWAWPPPPPAHADRPAGRRRQGSRGVLASAS